MSKIKSSQAQAAQAIRKELKEAFPGVKFSVTSEGYSMGDSVHINWTDGPSTKQVETYTKKYQYGHFNGMEDLYENSNNRDDIPQSKFVFAQRELSDEFMLKAAKYVHNKYGGLEDHKVETKEDTQKSFEWNNEWTSYSQIVWKEFSEVNLTGDAVQNKEDQEKKKKEDDAKAYEEYEAKQKVEKIAREKREAEKQKYAEENGMGWFEEALKSTRRNTRFELELDKAKVAIKLIGRWNDYDPEKINKMLDKIKDLLGGDDHFLVSVGTDTIWLKHHQFHSDKPQRDLEEVAQKIKVYAEEAIVDEYDYEIETYEPTKSKSLSIRLWWD